MASSGKINLHFICDPLLSPDVIERQLLNSLKPTYRLSSDAPEVTWSEVITIESLIRLGGEIKSQVPENELHRYDTDLIEGFNNVCVPFESAMRAVEQNTALADHVLIAVGKTEWAALKWNDQSIATKKTLLNAASLVFTAAATRQDFYASRDALKEANVNSRLVDCSDAHTWANGDDKDRLGNVLTWINADPTFNGLQHATREYEHRVTVEPRPPALVRKATRPTTIIDRVTVRPVPEAPPNPALFDCEICLNPGFVVILGNKGQGKSALLDTIAAAANSDRYDDYSFLTTARFRRRNGEAQYYVATITWADSTSSSVNLSEPFTSREPVRVDYLPQSLIERVCVADPYSKQKQHFEAEIERVVFGHLSAEERGDATSLRQLLDQRKVVPLAELDAARSKIADAARRIIRLQDRKSELHGLDLDARRTVLSNSLRELNESLVAAEAELATLRAEAGASALQSELDTLLRSQSEMIGEKERTLRTARDLDSRAKVAEETQRRLMEELESVRATAAELANSIGRPDSPLLEIHFREDEVVKWRRLTEQSALDLRMSVENARMV